MTRRNLIRLPVVFLLRVPLLALGAAFLWAGHKLQAWGFALPALERED